MRACWQNRRTFLGRGLAGFGVALLARAVGTVAAGFDRGLAHAQALWAQVAGLATELL
jgi:hypothetical protein